MPQPTHNPSLPDWRALFRRHGPALVLLARQRGLSRDDAEDVVQDAFIRLWQKGDAVAHVNDHAAYLFASVRNGSLDFRRGESRRQRREEAVAAETKPFEDALWQNAAEHEELASRVQALLGELPDEQREVIVMKVWGDLTFAQIAEATDTSANTIASRYRYALAAMRGLLATEMQP